jgi:hypothetical protein|tara:strand:+ start:270 stop:638 length:369 start_codon:yes stop_codon:yes gene_type:complete
MNNKFKINEEEKNHIRGLHNINEQSGFVEAQGGSDSLSKFNKRQDVGEQKMSGLPTDGIPPVAPEDETEISPEMTHDQFMKQLDGMCPEIIKQEKRVGNRSCKKCHTDTMTLLKKYCKTRAR